MQRFSEFIAQYPDVDREAGQELHDISALVQELDRKGELTLKVKVNKQNQRVMAQVGVDGKPPRPDAEAGLWHVGPDGLMKDDPFQVRFDSGTGELITPDHPRED